MYGLETGSILPKKIGKPGTIIKKLVCSGNTLACSRRDQEIEDRKKIKNDNLKFINKSCDADIRDCLDYSTDKKKNECITRRSKVCIKRVDEEIDDYIKDRNRILERYKYNPAIEEICDSLP